MLCLLGSLSIQDRDRREPLRLRPKAEALLARLAVGGDRVSRDELARMLFPDAADPRGALRWHLRYLRSVLPSGLQSCLETTPDHVRWTGLTDVSAFGREAARLLAQTLAIADVVTTLKRYQGDLCMGLTVSASPEFDNWLYVEQEALRRTFRQLTIQFARQALATGQAHLTTEPLARLVSVDPYCEDGHILLIQAYEAAQNLNGAARSYQRYQAIVRQELQAEPASFVARRYESHAQIGPRLPVEDLVQVGDITLHTVEWSGQEPTILAIHGSAICAYTLTALAERLAPQVRVVAFDLRGWGLGDKPVDRYHVECHAADARQLIAELGLRRPIVLGYSLGGAIATLVASNSQSRVRGLILLDGVVGQQAFTSNAAAKVVGPMVAAGMARFGGFTEYLAQWQHEPLSADAERLLQRVVRYELAPLPDGRYRRRGLRKALEDTWASLEDVTRSGNWAACGAPC
jgi:DNA-binding SARP family transcriptional activator/pimeloyl-ACP methyl ester carboxylesterase